MKVLRAITYDLTPILAPIAIIVGLPMVGGLFDVCPTNITEEEEVLSRALHKQIADTGRITGH